MKLDLLVLASHPDDAELSCAGTIITHINRGYKVGIVDLTRGEMGTRGTAELRIKEAEEASEILGLSIRKNLEMEDIFFRNDKENQFKLIKAIRKYRPEIVLANAVSDRHIDHGKGARLAVDACFMAGLSKISTQEENMEQEAWRPKNVYHYIQNNFIKPDFVVDVTEAWEQKIKAIKAFRSQFYDPESTEQQTFISTPDFLKFIESRSRELGHSIGVKYGEGFTVNKNVGVTDLFALL
ncbi:bacillithiol biosynthesis deacetylase BshB1 [soil metagenome]